MLIQRAYKTELDPTAEQIRRFRHCSEVTQCVYNYALGKRNEAYDRDASHLKSADIIKSWRSIRPAWTRGASSWCEHAALDALDAAYQNWFDICAGKRPKPEFRPRKDRKPNGFPKRRRDPTTFALWKIRNNHVKPGLIRLPNIGWVRLKERGYLPTSGVKINRATISQRAGRWFVSLQVEETVRDHTPAGPPIAVDLGITHLVTAVDAKGTVAYHDNPRALIVAQRKLRRLNKELARRTKGSANWRKTQEKIARANYRIACIRKHATHQATSDTVKRRDPQTLILEDLNVKGMLANHHIARAASDAAMGELGRQLRYKAEENGTEIIELDRWFPSSKQCPICGWMDDDLTLSDRIFRCAECGFTAERDYKACLSMLREAGKHPDSNACGEERSGPADVAAG